MQFADDGDASQNAVSVLTLRPGILAKTIPGNTPVKHKKDGFYNLSVRKSDLNSDTPGHAMKVTNYTWAQGAILGKAMTGVTEGIGLILVLVALQ